MRKTALILSLAVFFIIFLSGCKNQQSDTSLGLQDAPACPTDNKICPDGSIVDRVPPKCDFSDCPQTTDTFCDYGSPKRDYKGKSPEECKRIKFQCESGQAFSDSCGCGCTVDYTPPDLSNSKTTNTN